MTPNRVNTIVKKLTKMVNELDKAEKEAEQFAEKHAEAAERERSNAEVWSGEAERAGRVRDNIKKLTE